MVGRPHSPPGILVHSLATGPSMIVTCENCSARYKLDESNIAGRGARITCPRCRHVFVVYKESAPTVAIPAAAAPEAEGEGATSFFEAPAQSVDVHSLDFRKVGIPAWKVKVRIGLVYDFNDFRTLSRYIAEGRVTPSDKLSHDGKTWTEIGQIPDLERHFIEVYRDAEKAQAQAAAAAQQAAEPFEEEEPTNIMGMGGVESQVAAAPSGKAVALGSFSEGASSRILPPAASPEPPPKAPAKPPPTPEGPRFVDPFEKRKNDRQKQPASGAQTRPNPTASPKSGATNNRPAKGEKEPAKLPVGMIAAGALLLLGGLAAAWYFTQNPTPAPTPAPARTQPGDAGPSREEVNERIRDSLEPAGEEPPPTDGFDAPEQPALIPVGPRDGNNRRAAQPAPRNNAAAGSQATARDHAAVGDDAARRGDWSGAQAAYRNAVSLEPRNAAYNGKLGEAIFRGGDAAGATGPLTTAAQGGYGTAWRTLGDAAASLGDRSGAIDYYQRYLGLRPAPRDSAEVQRRIDQLSGS
jgi:predicted Zn finger-like uncharacterized protein